MKDIFDRASEVLEERYFIRWLCFAYGVLRNSATESQKQLLDKALEQDIKRQVESILK